MIITCPSCEKKFEIDERVEADDGYQGEDGFIDIPHETKGLKIIKKRKQLARSRHERLNGRLKQWIILKNVYRHDLRKHKYVFEAVAVIVQLEIDNGKVLNKLEY